MLRIGLTGNMGSGKTFVADIFHSFGIPVFFADKEARKLFSHDKIKNQIRGLFGNEVFDKEGNISRPRLAEIVFLNNHLLAKLNRIIHPAVIEEYKNWLEHYSNVPYTLYEAAILYESGHYSDMDRIICVTSPEEVRIRRVINRDGITPEEAKLRMENQWDESRKAEMADFIIINDGVKEVEMQVEQIHKQIMLLTKSTSQ
ncbi:MAG: dephospho-CoA kinase [Bacteroidales bacterium]|jgi:dephospho-CoA kinase|nr:dephospho-CoA kinase [Bacteroidales bacterium]